MYYEYMLFDAISDGEYESADKAHEAAQEAYDNYCDDQEGLSNGDTMSDTVAIILHTDDGQPVLGGEFNATVEFEKYHGDFEEHNTLYKGGVL